MNNTKTHQRVCAKIPYPLYIQLKNFASAKYSFEKGYTQKAIQHSIYTWVWMMDNMDHEMRKALIEIGEKEFGDIKDPRKRHQKMMVQALTEFIENHKVD